MVPFAKQPETWKFEQIAKIDDTARSFLQMAGSAASRFNDLDLKQLVGEDLGKPEGMPLLTNPLFE